MIALIVVGIAIVAYVSVPRSHRPKRQRAQRVRRKPRRARSELDLGMLVTEVATRLRSGSSVERAWSTTLANHGLDAERGGTGEVLGDDGSPVALAKLSAANWFLRRRLGISPAVHAALPAALAVCRMSARTGAPMADVLDACAEGITEAGEARSARDVALAGPKSSAKMLAFLPVIGLALGYALGADPLGFLLTTPVGNLAIAAGLAFEVTGLVWVRKLVGRAVSEND